MSKEKALKTRAKVLFASIDSEIDVEVEKVFQVTIRTNRKGRDRKPLYDVEFTLMEEFPGLLIDFSQQPKK